MFLRCTVCLLKGQIRKLFSIKEFQKLKFRLCAFHSFCENSLQFISLLRLICTCIIVIRPAKNKFHILINKMTITDDENFTTLKNQALKMSYNLVMKAFFFFGKQTIFLLHFIGFNLFRELINIFSEKAF